MSDLKSISILDTPINIHSIFDDKQEKLSLLRDHILYSSDDGVEWELGDEQLAFNPLQPDEPFLFHPMACVLEHSDLYIYNRPGVIGPGTMKIHNIEPLIWGFLGPNEYLTRSQSMNISSGMNIHFTPYTVQQAESSQRALINGFGEWVIYGQNQSTYKIFKVWKDYDNLFLQTNMDNDKINRCVVRVDKLTAKKYVIQSILKDNTPQQLWHTNFPIQVYDEMFSINGSNQSQDYINVVRQAQYLNKKIFNIQNAYNMLYVDNKMFLGGSPYYQVYTNNIARLKYLSPEKFGVKIQF